MDDRYWIDDNPTKKPFGPNSVGIVDEEMGGVVAYANSEHLACDIIDLLCKYCPNEHY